MAFETRNKWPVARNTHQGLPTLKFLVDIGLEKTKDEDPRFHWMHFPEGWTRIPDGEHRQKYLDKSGVAWFIQYDDKKFDGRAYIIPLKLPRRPPSNQ